MRNNTLSSLSTRRNACCAEFCTIPEWHDIIAVGTYQLVESGWIDQTAHSNTKSGEILLYACNFKDLEKLSNDRIVEKSVIDTNGGVFDLKWLKKAINNCGVIACVNTSGTLDIYSISRNFDTEKIDTVSVGSGVNAESALYVDFQEHNTSYASICYSTEVGSIAYAQLSSSGIQKERLWENAHSHETWVSVFDRHNLNIIYSGGDDNLLRMWDTRSNSDSPLMSLNHRYGVVSIVPNYHKENIIISGSYDENIYIWDNRRGDKPLVKSLFLGGGVWRLKPHHLHNELVVAACMQEGFKIIHINSAGSYNEHSSLAYGVSWYQKNSEKNIIASCSFYDSKFNTWTVDL